jgi:predicted DsbA family dithiol-disulfide isomerase
MLTIEIFSDVICPWCFIGKRRLDKALDGETGAGVTVRWRPYQLYPHAPIEGWDRQDFMQRRYGAAAESGRVPSRIREEAEQEGLDLRYDLIRRVPNTLLAHRLMELAELKDSQHALAEALFVGYFCNGEDVGDIDTLAGIGAQVGLDPNETHKLLAGDFAQEEVQQQLQRAPELGVVGVPGYVLGGGFLLPGAQSVDTMQQIIMRAKLRLGNGL